MTGTYASDRAIDALAEGARRYCAGGALHVVEILPSMALARERAFQLRQSTQGRRLTVRTAARHIKALGVVVPVFVVIVTEREGER